MDKDYHTITQFLSDHTFHNWVHQSNTGDIVFWENWINQHPERLQEVNTAKDIILGIQFSPVFVPDEYIQTDWKTLESIIKQDKSNNSRSGFRFELVPVAAMLFLVLMIGVGIYNLIQQQPKSIIHRTSFGETMIVALPDQSQVYLNSNSSITYRIPWNSENPRKVELSGEAYFDIVRQPKTGNDTFKVITHDLIVEVLGTSFNLNGREVHSQITLEEGSVKLKHHQYSNSIVMSPGELAAFSPEVKKFVKRPVRTEIYSSWKEDRWIFDATSIETIAQKIRSRYGVEVVIKDPAMAQRQLSGSITVSDLELLLKALSSSFEIDITQQRDTIYIDQG